MSHESLPSHATGSLEEGPVESALHVLETFDVEPPYGGTTQWSPEAQQFFADSTWILVPGLRPIML